MGGCEGKRHHDGRGGLLGQQAGHAGAIAERPQQRLGDVQWGGQDDRIKTILTLRGREPPTPAIALDPQHRLPEAQ